MIIDCISDLHGEYPKLEGGDLLIVAGDLTARDMPEEYKSFDDWIYDQKYRMKIVIAGNHDNRLKCDDPFLDGILGIHPEYLCDSGVEFEGLKIWGSPWTKRFDGMNPKCMAFTLDNDQQLAEKWSLIPSDIDILVTHSPPHGILDHVPHGNEHAGSISLRNEVLGRIKPKLHVFGHIHEWGGQMVDLIMTKSVNASYVNEYYRPVNKPVRVHL